MEKPLHPSELGIIDITLDDLYAYADLMEKFNNAKAFIPVAYVSAIPVCPPANYPEPLPSQNMGLSLAQLPQPVPGRQCPPAQPSLWSKKRASSCSKKTG